MKENTRMNEWYVPKFGPLKFRVIIGMLFLPYTGMCISFVVWGSLISNKLNMERMIAISIIYFLSLGIAAHFADNMGSKKIKPWSDIFSKKQSWSIIITSLLVSYSIGLYYIIYFTPLLLVIGIIETFFLFAYNFELYKNFFHNDFWFSVSWGMLSFLSGFIIQTNTLSYTAIIISLIPFILSYLEIRISRIYKELKRNKLNIKKARKCETLLKILSLGTITGTIFLIILRI